VYLRVQSYNQVWCQLAGGQHGADVGEVHVVPESGAVLAVVQQCGGDVLALPQGVVKTLPLHDNNLFNAQANNKVGLGVEYLVATGLRPREEAAVLANDLVQGVARQLGECKRRTDHREEVRRSIDDIECCTFSSCLAAKLVEDGHYG
jgi:hypothetical protein